VAATKGAVPTPSPATFVDESACAECHRRETERWRGSDHDLAMQEATGATVLADFRDTTFRYAGVTTRFSTRAGKFFVSTDGPDGRPTEYEVSDTFGVDPLQQYLVPFPGGRKQALSVTWDARKRRWFRMYPGERIDHNDELHWTKRSQNWNYMCAECHATDLKRNWDPALLGYRTTAARFDVGCQACHGPGSRHVDLARRAARGDIPKAEARTGLDVSFRSASSTVEIEMCARCHSRRAPLGDGFRHANRLMDDYLPSLLDEDLYYADGQIREEVYEYGSFLQSRMYAKGLRCSDCHDPHGARLLAPGDAMCMACHNATTPVARPHVNTKDLKHKEYDSPSHHFHKMGGPGSHCVDCHMPQRTYMVVDPRRDHSFRIPRPDLSVELGTPNACNNCHTGKDARWAAAAVARWYGTALRQKPHYGEALFAGRRGRPGAAEALTRLAGDHATPAIVRATALSLLPEYPGEPTFRAFASGLADPDPLVRGAAVDGLSFLPPAERVSPLAALLADPVKALRISAVRQLAPAGPALLARQGAVWNRALAEYEAVQKALGGQPEAGSNLGGLYAELGRLPEAVAALREALRIDATFVPASVNLADVLRAAGDEAGAERALREGLRAAPAGASLHHALGLTLVRQGRHAEGLAELASAARLAPRDSRFGYVYAVALHDTGRTADAMRELERVIRERPQDREARLALVSYRRESGDSAEVQRLLAELAAINPADPALLDARAQRGN
jgi:predicted CXXCH cytochrome family protein